MIVVGIDFSLNHFGAVALDFKTGKPLKSWYTWDTAKYVKTFPEHCGGIFGLQSPKKEKEESNNHYNWRRWNFSVDTILSELSSVPDFSVQEVYICLEDYAFTDKTNRIVQIAEITGILKYLLVKRGCKLRMHEPGTIKMFGAGKGNALKIEMVKAAKARGYEVPNLLLRPVKKKVRGVPVDDFDGPGTDLCDAFHMANALRLELQVREGFPLEKVDAYTREKLFLRVTKENPVNVLAREFFCHD